MDRRRLLAGLGATAVGIGGCLRVLGGGCGVEDFHVGMTPTAFEPRELTVEGGTTVVWLNDSDRAHTVTAYDADLPEGADFFASGDFDSTAAARRGWRDNEGAIYTCETFEHTFDVAGEYPYFCIPHEQAGMRGTIVVEE